MNSPRTDLRPAVQPAQDMALLDLDTEWDEVPTAVSSTPIALRVSSIEDGRRLQFHRPMSDVDATAKTLDLTEACAEALRRLS